jgi:hypothetical protein
MGKFDVSTNRSFVVMRFSFTNLPNYQIGEIVRNASKLDLR